VKATLSYANLKLRLANAAHKNMKKAAVLLGTFALILPTHLCSQPLYAHLSRCIEVNLANDLAIRLPLRTDLSRIAQKENLDTCFDCYVGPFGDLEPLSLSLHTDFAISLSDIFE
jgi:hypothetical protein